jgi:hypothetical protein
MTFDGATIAVDWEVPFLSTTDDDEQQQNQQQQQLHKQSILNGPITRPVVIILHGINNDSTFGYMKSLQRTFVKRGWNAASMNFRGCGRVAMTTPRPYNGAYTGDLRSLVQQVSCRLSPNTPLFLVGNSLGANIMTKYLGEEGLAGTCCVSGAVSLGNPLVINSSIVRFPFSVLMGLGVKTIYLEHWKSVFSMNDYHSRRSFRRGLLAPTIAASDRATSPMFIRNDPHYPFGVQYGYPNGGDEYWFDASSYRHVRHINVPFLNITAQDDFLVSRPSRNKLGYCLSNPNVMVVETRCGGHLGWQETPPDNTFGSSSSSWADTATADFFDAVMKSNTEMTGCPVSPQTFEDGLDLSSSSSVFETPPIFPDKSELQQIKSDTASFAQSISSRL